LFCLFCVMWVCVVEGVGRGETEQWYREGVDRFTHRYKDKHSHTQTQRDTPAFVCNNFLSTSFPLAYLCVCRLPSTHLKALQ
jgi:hypothetical protein